MQQMSGHNCLSDNAIYEAQPDATRGPKNTTSYTRKLSAISASLNVLSGAPSMRSSACDAPNTKQQEVAFKNQKLSCPGTRQRDSSA
jgi:hypothetical protein